MIKSFYYEDGVLRVVERIDGYDLVHDGVAVSAQLEVESVTRDPLVIIKFFATAAGRAQVRQ